MPNSQPPSQLSKRQRPNEIEPEVLDAKSVSSELEGSSRAITAMTAAFCFVVSFVYMMTTSTELVSFFPKHFLNDDRTVSKLAILP